MIGNYFLRFSVLLLNFCHIVDFSKQILTNELLRLLKQESSSAIRLKVCDIAGELGGSILEPKDWPALAPACIELCKVSKLYIY